MSNQELQIQQGYFSNHLLKNLLNLDEAVACVLEMDPLSKATTLMLSKGFSQLLVMKRMPNNMVLREHIVGVISLRSIVSRLAITSISIDSPVREFVEQGQLSVCTEDSTLLSVLENLGGNEYITVLDSKGTFVKRMITAFDIAVLYKQKVIPYSQLEFIECFIRDRLVKFGILSPDDAYGEKYVFSDFISLFSKNWSKLEMGSLDYNLFVQLLENVRNARNAMMHFRTLDTASHKSIDEMIRLLNITK
ncbi:MAG: CBS domain-containing protein [Fibrobacter sp.]|uniref:hypothetical protein n=1 Tax=Fibrobacter sp. TaxID=35828 RepID=UPI0025BE7120|nr:hypothetical protein [Fibrobacter sp.]MBQ3716533.1 CBS domain-containing protein [Fibrobacter sp.]MBQ7079411.1 CBS domain-containing protein [Fibrobacter sp.]